MSENVGQAGLPAPHAIEARGVFGTWAPLARPRRLKACPTQTLGSHVGQTIAFCSLSRLAKPGKLDRQKRLHHNHE
jgi:hypothetical protein